ncbi:MAG TPA: hypothetical protein DD414_01375 [Lachnospiraceae bacterium]|nr:hypothetical protein [Lachnospiraceae bacterium]
MKIRWKKPRGWPTRRVLCPVLACVLALGTVVAAPLWKEEVQAAGVIDLEKKCSVTVTPMDAAGDSEFLEDFAKADVVVDLYQVAKAKEVAGYDTYTYDFESDYKSLEEAALKENITNEEWKALAQDAAKIAVGAEDGTTLTPVLAGQELSTPIKDLDCGLYLVIARGRNLTEAAKYVKYTETEDGKKVLDTIAMFSQYIYTFAPILISLPTKESVDGSISTANPGDWIYDPTISLKWEADRRFGPLEIVKSLQAQEMSEPATFVFSVEAVLDGENVYSDVVTITFTEPGEQVVLIEDKIPVGAEVTVTEVYSGAVYTILNDVSQTVTIAADQVVGVQFINNYSRTEHGGGSVVNHFDHTDAGWSWSWTRDDGQQGGTQ